MSDNPDRRAFLKGLGVVGAAGVAGVVPVPADAAQAPEALAAPKPVAASAAQKSAAAAAANVPHSYSFLTPPEAAFVEKAVSRLIPADELTPSGADCGVAIFIDRQLGSAWGAGDRMYMQGPWQKGTPTQGYQLPLTPGDLFRAGIAATNAYCRQTFQKEFDRLTPDQQVTVLKGLEQGQVALDTVPANEFFSLLLQTTIEGFFSDPMYGGNRDKVSWKMVGFPGVIEIHRENIKNYHNRKYQKEPTSVEDLS